MAEEKKTDWWKVASTVGTIVVAVATAVIGSRSDDNKN